MQQIALKFHPLCWAYSFTFSYGVVFFDDECNMVYLFIVDGLWVVSSVSLL